MTRSSKSISYPSILTNYFHQSITLYTVQLSYRHTVFTLLPVKPCHYITSSLINHPSFLRAYYHIVSPLRSPTLFLSFFISTHFQTSPLTSRPSIKASINRTVPQSCRIYFIPYRIYIIPALYQIIPLSNRPSIIFSVPISNLPRKQLSLYHTNK